MRPALIATLLLAPPTAAAASAAADCARPDRPAEAAVCLSPRLTQLDRIVSDRYGDILGAVEGQTADAVRRRHESWLAARDACGRDGACLEGAYRARLRELGL